MPSSRAINERFLQKQRVFCLFIDSKAKTTFEIWVVYFTYTLTQTLVCICILTADKPCLKRPFIKEDQTLVLKTDYCLLQFKSISECSKREHSAILLTFIQLPLVFLSLFFLCLSGRLRQVLLYLHYLHVLSVL